MYPVQALKSISFKQLLYDLVPAQQPREFHHPERSEGSSNAGNMPVSGTLALHSR